MRTIEKTIYKFDELDKDIQEKLIKEEKEYCFNSYMENFFQDDMEHKAQELVDDYFGGDADFIQTYYSLSYSQGDGAMIEFDINIEDLNNKYNLFSVEEMRFIMDKGIINYISVRHNDNHYYHEYTFNVDYEYYNDWSYDDIKDDYKITEFNFNSIEDRMYELLDSSNKHYTESMFIKDIINMNRELVKFGYNTIENYEEDIDFVIENFSENEYYENGDVYYG